MPNAAAGRNFPDTSWGLVLSTGEDDAARARNAFAALCRQYWMPIYATLRRQGFARDDAEDLTQGFFHHLIEHGTVTHADRERGRFRSFLLGVLRRFLVDERERASARKRGSEQSFVTLDVAAYEAQSAAHDDMLSLDLQFDRQWARTLLANALAALREDYAHGGQIRVYEALRPCLDPGATLPDYAEFARRLARNEGAVKVAVHRLRQRFREALRHAAASTVANAQDVDAELAYLRDVLAAQAAL